MHEPNQQDYLEHYGVKGMRWGVRKDERPNKSEKKTTKTIKRELAAATRNLKTQAQIAAGGEAQIAGAKAKYAAAQSKIAFTKRGKQAKLSAIKKASENLSKTYEMNEFSRSEMKRAVEIYNDTAKRMWDNTAALTKKYGSTQVKAIKYKAADPEVAQYVSQVMKTGITIANIPFYGQKYTGKVVASKTLSKREQAFNEKAKQRY